MFTRDGYQRVIEQTNQASVDIAVQTDVSIVDHLERIGAKPGIPSRSGVGLAKLGVSPFEEDEKTIG